MYDKIPGSKDLAPHYKAMRDGDNRLAYMQDGEMVLSLPVQEAYPELAVAVLRANKQLGFDPSRFTAGSNSGRYNEKTGVQEFNTGSDWQWLTDMWDTGTQYVSDAWDATTDFFSSPTPTDTQVNGIDADLYDQYLQADANGGNFDYLPTIGADGNAVANSNTVTQTQYFNDPGLQARYDTAALTGDYSTVPTIIPDPVATTNNVGQQVANGVSELPWYEELYNNATQSVSDSWDKFKADPLASPYTQSALTGLGTYAAARLSGASNEQALQTGIGGALGYGLAGGEGASDADKVFGGLMGAYKGYDSYIPPPEAPKMEASMASNPVNYTDILNSTPQSYLEKNDQANVNATIAQPTPTPVTPRNTAGGRDPVDGVNYLEEVTDNEGNVTYKRSNQMGGRFGSNISGNSRRQGLTKGIGRKVLYID